MATLQAALTAFFYLSPISAGVAFLLAKSVATCLFHEPSTSSGTKRRRYTALTFQILIFATLVAEGISVVVQSRSKPEGWPSQAYFVYLVLNSFVQASLALGVTENPLPLWYPYIFAWCTNFAIEIPLLALHARKILPGSVNAELRASLGAIRVALLLLQILSALWFMLQDRRRGIKLDDESEALLSANGTANGGARDDPTIRKPTNTGTNSSESGDESVSDAFDDEDKKAQQRKAEQTKKMREAGSVWNYLKAYKIFIPILIPWKDRLAQIALSIIGVIIFAERFLTIALPRQYGIVINDLTTSFGTGKAPWGSIAVWLVFTWLNSSTGLSFIKGEAELIVQQFTYKALSTKSFSHIMGLSMDFHSGKNSGELISGMNQGSSLQWVAQYIFFTVLPMLVDLVLAIVYVYALFDVYMALIVLGSGVAYIYLGIKLTSWGVESRRKFKATQRLEEQIQNEAINNWTTVSHFNRAEYESTRFSTAIDAYNLAEWWYTQTYYIGGNAQSAVMLLGKILGLMLAVQRVVEGRATIGDFVTLLALWNMLEHPLDMLQYSVRKIQSMLVDSERLLELLSTKSSVVNKPGAKPLEIGSGEIVFKDVSFAYDARKPTLSEVSFTCKPGSTIALVGETGGGKSTILKLLYRYYDVTSGAILIDGQDIRDVDVDSLRDSFGMVPQDPSLFNVSIMENIRYARLDATDEEIKEACRAAAIHAKIESFPDGYSSKVGERGMKLSGGEMQRVAIARAILRNSKIILLDEATSQIDAETEATIQGAFKRLATGRTTFIIAHRLSTIQHADLIVVIEGGKIIQQGTHNDLFRQEGKYRTLWSKQLNKDVQSVTEELVKDEKKAGEDESSDGDGKGKGKAKQ